MTEHEPKAHSKKLSNGDAGPKMFPLFEPAEFMNYSKRNAEFVSRAARAYFNGAAQMNKELTEFVNHRMRKDFECARLLMSSKNGEDAFSAQAGFVEEAIKDYAEETSKVFNLAADLAKEAFHADIRS